MSGFNVVIPARYGSQRLPGKPLLEIAGRPMIEHVHRRACESGANEILIATDDPRIRDAATVFGGRVIMTDPHHASGTDRIAEVARTLGWPDDTLVVNLQGDEPLMPPALLQRVAATLAAHADADVATLAVPLDDTDQLFDANVVKVVTDRHGFALYFSRATIPWRRDVFVAGARPAPHWLDGISRHLGIYAYRAGFLSGYAALAPAPLEQMESLEQLRVLWHGGRIAVDNVDIAPPAGIDTAEDLQRVAQVLAG
ncbi:MAG: 3-deoxy-manno-octulosonate cytidylyltransferase [Gammaproteobacteria bacterium]|nr:3-deoxy-manno-octulosonate cytidylyltransferase [Gammaproteobacteria bacterium]